VLPAVIVAQFHWYGFKFKLMVSYCNFFALTQVESEKFMCFAVVSDQFPLWLFCIADYVQSHGHF